MATVIAAGVVEMVCIDGRGTYRVMKHLPDGLLEWAVDNLMNTTWLPPPPSSRTSTLANSSAEPAQASFGGPAGGEPASPVLPPVHVTPVTAGTVETPEIERQKRRNMERNKHILNNAMASMYVTSNIEDFSKEGVEKKMATLDTARLTAHMRNLLEDGKLKTITAHTVMFTLSTPDTFARYKDLVEPFKTAVMKQLKSLLDKL
eukprot:gene23325-28225_t